MAQPTPALRALSQPTIFVLFLSLTLAVLGGCSGDTTSGTNSSDSTSSGSRANSAVETPKVVAPVGNVGQPKADPAPSTASTVARTGNGKKRSRKTVELPRVILSEQHAATCRVQVGDKMPDLAVVDTDGESQTLSSFLGERVTVVCFWDAENPLSSWQLSDLGPEVVERFASQGVNVVAINRGQSIQKAREEADKAGVTFPILVDEDGQAYDQVATRYLPRTYLMDGEGKILWLDLGYSDDTRRHLHQAIHFALASDDAGNGTIRQ